MQKNERLIERFIQEGQAFVPQNVHGKGDAVLLFFRNGETETVDVRPELFLKRLVDFFGTSVAVNRSRYGGLIGKRNLVPVALSHGLVLVPYNTREPVGKQSRTGWVFSREIGDRSEQDLYPPGGPQPHAAGSPFAEVLPGPAEECEVH